MKTIKLKCHQCNIDFFKPMKEYNRVIKTKTYFFCSSSCSAKFNSPRRGPECYKSSSDRIRLLAGNRKDEFSPFRKFLNSAKGRDKNYNINLEYLKQLWTIQNGICPYTNLKMVLNNTTCSKNKSTLKHASLDRIDSSKGYTIGNVEFVCLFINFAKNKYSKEEITSIINELKLVGLHGNDPCSTD